MHVGIVGPCSNSVIQLANALVRRGHQVSIITLSSKVSGRTIQKKKTLTYYIYPERTQKRMRDLYSVERRGITEGILLARPDILHAQWTYEFAWACLETNYPTIITSRDNAFQMLRFSKDLYRMGRLFIQIYVLRKARFLTAVSPYLADSLQWLAAAPIQVIPNVIQMAEHKQSGCHRRSGAVRIITILNGWGDRKNAKAGIRAFNIVRRELPDSEMFIYGEGYEQEGPASRWASRNKLNQNIYFCGRIPYQELESQLKQMLILLHPSLEESFGMAVVEAMANGVAVVAGEKSGAVPWVLADGRAGFLTDVRKPKRIAETLLACVRDPDERQRRQLNAYDRLQRVFSPETIAKQYENAYQLALSAC